MKKKYGDTTVQAWIGIANGPIAMYDDEPARTGWAEILELAERIQPEPRLVPNDPEQRVLLFGLGHELLGAGGLMWAARLFTLEASFSTDGAQGFILPVAEYLAARYGYTPGCGAAAKAHAREVLRVMHERLQRAKQQGHEYLLGGHVSALDVYLAAALNALVLLPAEQCPIHPAIRPAFDYMRSELQDMLTPELLAHRDRVVSRHFQLPLLV